MKCVSASGARRDQLRVARPEHLDRSPETCVHGSTTGDPRSGCPLLRRYPKDLKRIGAASVWGRRTRCLDEAQGRAHSVAEAGTAPTAGYPAQACEQGRP